MPETFAHMATAEIIRRFLTGAARGINQTANAVAAVSLEEAPLGPAESAPKGGEFGEGHEGGGGSGALRRSALYPLIDEDSAATPDNLDANISYNTVYANAQHEGEAWQHRGSKMVHWVVRVYTTPGTKKKFLADPFKAIAVPNLDFIVAREITKEFGG